VSLTLKRYTITGSGRERADTKLRQNFELFIDNPYCRGMFLAVCYDGGFVRMLEPYQHLKDARNKIVLIKAGEVAPAFWSVPLFSFAEFPSVFQGRYSLKLAPMGRTLCTAEYANEQVGKMLCSDDGRDPEDLTIEEVSYAPWEHPMPYIHSTTMYLGLTHEATLLGAKSRGALSTPELIALGISSFQFYGSNDNTKASPTTAEEQRAKSRIRNLQDAIRQKQQVAGQPGISNNIRQILQLTAKSLEDEVARLKTQVAKRNKRISKGRKHPSKGT
jgi:hypothetical protein